MKTLLYIFVISLWGCGNLSPARTSLQADSPAVIKPPETRESQLYAAADSVKIISLTVDPLVYSKDDFNEIVDNFPTLRQQIPDEPDISYARSGYFKDITDKKGNKKHISFGSENGQDEYYILYAYFLKKHNQGKELAIRRKNISAIFLTLNSLMGMLTYGGTYFGHQVSRINAYAEYSVYEYRQDSEYFKAAYNTNKQKQLYTDLLKQKITDEVSIDNYVPTQAEKLKRQKELFQKVDELAQLLTDNFYLKEAEQFQFSNY
ncbi:MAG: hypothetical protein JSU05_13125 [Bacteroidetes bacterium]|nr:hypothetical protein [Bacteroidota bacterium]